MGRSSPEAFCGQFPAVAFIQSQHFSWEHVITIYGLTNWLISSALFLHHFVISVPGTRMNNRLFCILLRFEKKIDLEVNVEKYQTVKVNRQNFNNAKVIRRIFSDNFLCFQIFQAVNMLHPLITITRSVDTIAFYSNTKFLFSLSFNM